MIEYTLPVLGFCAYSGTGKTTLLARLIPLLKSDGMRIGVVKHAHHSFDIDHPGKDSHTLRSAGAVQMLVASRDRLAWVEESPGRREEPSLAEALAALDMDSLDLVLVEGFKRESFPKIELHRPSLGHPLIHPHDPNIIAVATDTPLLTHAPSLPHLDLNRPEQICGFVRRWIHHHKTDGRGSRSHLRVMV